MTKNSNHQWAVKAFLKGYLRVAINSLIKDGYTRDEAVDFLKDVVEANRQEEIFTNITVEE